MEAAGTTHRAHYRLTFAVLSVSAMAFSILQSLIIPAIPDLERALHSSADAVAWLLTGYLISAVICTPILGRVGDMFGKARVLRIILVVLLIGTLMCAVATSLPLMLAGRVVQGTGGAVFPLAFGIIRDEFPPERVVGAIGFLSSILGVGIGLGIVLAGPIVQHLDYHWLFWAPLFLCIVGAGASFFVPESPVRTRGRLNVPGAVLMSGWLVAASVGVSEGPTIGWGSPAVIALFGVAALLVPVWIRSESRATIPLIDMRMMRIPEVWTTNLCALLFGFGLYVMFTILPQYVETSTRTRFGLGASVTQSGLDLLPFAVAMLVVAPMTGKLSNAFGSRRVLLAGCVFSAVAYVELLIWHAHTWQIMIAAGLLGVGLAMGYAAMSNLVVQAVPHTQTGVATGMNTNIRNMGSAVGAGVATSMVVSTVLRNGTPAQHGYLLAFVVSAIALVIAAGIALLIPEQSGVPIHVADPVEGAEGLSAAAAVLASAPVVE
jgi:MFS family permease